MKKKPETPPPENSLDKLAALTRRILAVPKSSMATKKVRATKRGDAPSGDLPRRT
jgi:hypothetical protein